MGLFSILQQLMTSLWKHRELILQLTKREVNGRYKGSYLGILWSYLNPLLMLVIYTFVFSVVFKTKWGIANESKTEFAMILFCGITTFNLFAEVISRAPNLILDNVNYVKKVVFPLEVLPLVTLGSAIVSACISLLILLVALVVLQGVFHWTVVLIPLVLLPLMLLALGFGWLLSSLGVYMRDIGHLIVFAMQALMFMSPIFYPVSLIPSYFRFVFYINPLSYVVEDMRSIIVWGQQPNWEWVCIGTVIGALFAFLGYIWFQKTRGGFADVL